MQKRSIIVDTLVKKKSPQLLDLSTYILEKILEPEVPVVFVFLKNACLKNTYFGPDVQNKALFLLECAVFMIKMTEHLILVSVGLHMIM